MKKLLIWLMLIIGIIFWNSSIVSAGLIEDLFDSGWPAAHVCQGDECGWDDWVEAVRGAIEWAETQKPASQYIQDIVNYLLSFLAIVWVLYIIYAWFNILTAGWDDDKVSGSKKTITFVAVGLLVIFLASSIINFIFSIFDETLSEEPQANIEITEYI